MARVANRRGGTPEMAAQFSHRGEKSHGGQREG
jgi:hypothetical protein